MPYSPATPSKSAKGSPLGTLNVAIPSAEKPSSTSKAKQSVVFEPSPASTYGDTVVGDDSPATPFESGKHDSTAALIHSLKSVYIEPTGDVHVESSPAAAKTNDHPIYGLNMGQSSSQGDGGHPNATSAGSSPSGRLRTQGDINSPSWRSSSDFVQHSRRSQADDPFVSPSHGRGNVSSQGPEDTPSRRGNINADPPHPAVQPNAQDPNTSFPATPNFTPRQDRVGQEISVDNAQAVLPPLACVFVANLSSLRTDEQLEYSVTRVFKDFGNVYVKIRRDGKGMPFAFCQYETVADANLAVFQGRGMLIDGRPCRTEKAKVNRSLFLSKISGGPISEEEARRVLSQFGAIEKVWYNTQTDKEMFRLPEGIWVMFAYFQDCRDAQAAFRENYRYRLEQPAMPADIRSRLNRQAISPTTRASPARTGFQPQQSMLRKVTEDCTIFVGSLPSTVTQEQLIRLFGSFGHIKSVEIVAKPSINNSGVNVFAFVEFSSEEEACAALDAEHALDGFRLRVERKESVDQLTRRTIDRRTPPGSQFIAKTLANMNNNEDVAHFYNRAIEIGIAASTAAEIFSPTRHTGEAFQTVGSPAAVYPGTIPYSYYHTQYNAGPSTAQYANHNFDTGHDENGSGLSPSRQGPTYYPQAGNQGQMTPSTGLQTSAVNAQLQPLIHPSIAQPMGQFQYPQTALPYGQYQANPYYHYAAQQIGSGAPLFQYAYPQTDTQAQTGTMPTSSAEEAESR